MLRIIIIIFIFYVGIFLVGIIIYLIPLYQLFFVLRITSVGGHAGNIFKSCTLRNVVMLRIRINCFLRFCMLCSANVEVAD